MTPDYFPVCLKGFWWPGGTGGRAEGFPERILVAPRTGGRAEKFPEGCRNTGQPGWKCDSWQSSPFQLYLEKAMFFRILILYSNTL